MARAWDATRSAARTALELVLPPACAGCGTEGRVLCITCQAAVDARLEEPAGVPLGLPSDVPEPLLQLEWCAPFAAPVRSALHALKYGGERRLAGPLGEAIARRWRRTGIMGAQFWLTGTLWASVITHASYNGLTLLDWRCLHGQWNPTPESLPQFVPGMLSLAALAVALLLIVALLRWQRAGALAAPAPSASPGRSRHAR